MTNKEAIANLNHIYGFVSPDIQRSLDIAIKAIEDEPQGEWIKKVDNVGFISHICSECGAEIELENPCDNKFCWNCGAKMGGKQP